MNLPDRLHCPDCRGRLRFASPSELICTACDQTVPVVDEIADFVGAVPPSAGDPHRYGADRRTEEAAIGDLPARIRAAAGGRWPDYLGDVLEIGCGTGQMTKALVAGDPMRSMLAIDTSLGNVRDCRDRLASLDEPPVAFATLSGRQQVIRDAVANTVLGLDVLARTGDIRDFLAMVYRVLKPGGSAWFVVPNRRYYQAFCLAMAEALTQGYARDGTWPEGLHIAAGVLARTRLLLVHQGDAAFLADLEQKHLFDSEALQDLAKEIGFATAEMLPLDPDPFGGQSTRTLLEAAGASEEHVASLAPLAASVGQLFFRLLGRQDASLTMLLWLTKGAGPQVRVFNAPATPPPIGFGTAVAAVAGPNPRWSVELLATDTPIGVTVKVGGWCLANVDVRWVCIMLGGIRRETPVWQARPDVHEVLNRTGVYHSLNALCSGLDAALLFGGVHPVEDLCSLRLEVVLSNGLVLVGPAPETLRMNEQLVINQ